VSTNGMTISALSTSTPAAYGMNLGQCDIQDTYAVPVLALYGQVNNNNTPRQPDATAVNSALGERGTSAPSADSGGATAAAYGVLRPTYGAVPSQPPQPARGSTLAQYDHLTVEPREAVYEVYDADAPVSPDGSGTVAYGGLRPTYGAASPQQPRPASGSARYDHLDVGTRGAGQPAQAAYDDAYAPPGNSDNSGAVVVPYQYETPAQPGDGGSRAAEYAVADSGSSASTRMLSFVAGVASTTETESSTAGEASR